MIKMITTLIAGLMVLAACSSTPPPKDYRYDEQKRAADKAQEELSRGVRKGY